MESFLAVGTLKHRRLSDPPHEFTYPLFMLYVDLGELESVFAGRWLWSTASPNVAWLRRADHYGDPRLPLDVAIRDLVEGRTGKRPKGPIRLLTNLRYLGYGFSPVSFYYCFLPDGRTLETVVAEVSNTPWNERHMYVLPSAEPAPDRTTEEFRFEKEFHVSPFLGMNQDYRWRFGRPPLHDGETLWVSTENREGGASVFLAALVLERRAIDGRSLARALARHPAMTAEVIVSIYAQAFRLWLKRAPFYPHPRRSPSRES